ncbi:MAG: DUF3108 domain-containing protein [Chitinivibrionales bacterium]|nr:DUF3108 domain-containing protein [Chitinivibrionales bacterium]
MGSGYMKNKSLFISGMVPILVWCMMWNAFVYADSGEDEAWWARAARECSDLIFPAQFWDSLKQCHGIATVAGLRTRRVGPFAKGEKLTYEAAWGPMKAGRGVLKTWIDSSNKTVHCSVKGMTNKFTGAFFKVRDFLYSEIDLQGLYCYTFEEHVREGRYKADRYAYYDHPNSRVFSYKNKEEPIQAPKFTHSVVSLLCELRSRDINPQDTFSINTFVQGKNYRVFFGCKKREKIKTDAGEFTCLLIEPVLTGKGRVFTKKDKVRIWFTDDKYAVPVMYKIKIAIGSVTVRLIEYERG